MANALQTTATGRKRVGPEEAESSAPPEERQIDMNPPTPPSCRRVEQEGLAGLVGRAER